MNYQLKKTVAMVGMMGAGKTAVGTAVARRLGVPFLDSDRAIESAADRTILEIFEQYGETFFREKEAQVIARLVETERCILSTGGGAYLSDINRDSISRFGVAVWLRADVDILWKRVRHKTTRPLLRTENPRATLEALCRAREPEYAKAEIAVDADPDFSIEEMANRVISALLDHPDVLEATP